MMNSKELEGLLEILSYAKSIVLAHALTNDSLAMVRKPDPPLLVKIDRAIQMVREDLSTEVSDEREDGEQSGRSLEFRPVESDEDSDELQPSPQAEGQD